MSVRNYTSKLLFLLRTTCKYIRRYQPQLENFLDDTGKTALAAVVTACEAMEDILAVANEIVN